MHKLMPGQVPFEPTAEAAHVALVGLLLGVFPLVFTQSLCHCTVELAESALSD